MYVICKNMRNTQSFRYNIRRDVIYKIARGIVIAKFELYEYLCSSLCGISIRLRFDNYRPLRINRDTSNAVVELST